MAAGCQRLRPPGGMQRARVRRSHCSTGLAARGKGDSGRGGSAKESLREASEAAGGSRCERDARRDVEEQRLRCETAVSKAAEGAAHALAEALRERDEARAERTARENAIKASEAHAAREAEHRGS